MGSRWKLPSRLRRSRDEQATLDRTVTDNSEDTGAVGRHGSSSLTGTPVKGTSKSSRAQIDQEPWGLKVLAPGVDPVVEYGPNIVAVHGLNGHRERTWTTTEDDILWLRDLLPPKIPNARIFTWGYDSRTHTKSHKDSLTTKKLYDHGRELVYDLDGERRETNTTRRPLIFVAHSLGGIVVKGALLHSDRVRKGHLEEQRSIKLSTYGIIFMGTPHQGGQGVSMAAIMLNIAKLRGNTSDNLLQHLEEHSEVLEQQMAEFTAIGQDFEINFAYETRPTPLAGDIAMTIVPKWSAVVPGTPDAAEFGIDKDHRRMTAFSHAEDQDFKKISRSLKSMAHKAPSIIKGKWSKEEQSNMVHKGKTTYAVPFDTQGIPAVSDFVPRETEMERMEEVLRPGARETSRRTLVLHGLGGSGKTQLALGFAERLRKRFTAIFWLDGQTEDSLKKSLANVARQLPEDQISESSKSYDQNGASSMERAIDEVLNWFGKSSNCRWLLIYDNVDRERSNDPDEPGAYDLARYLPRMGHGSVIITTRLLQLRSRGKELHVSCMTHCEGLQLLEQKRGLPATDQSSAGILVDRLGALPLAIAQAGSYMRETGTSIDQYLNLYESMWDGLMKEEALHPMEHYGDRSISTTWSITFDEIRFKNKAAVLMLQLWSFLNNRDIWFGLFNGEEGPNPFPWADFPQWYQSTVRDQLVFKRTARVLLAYSLIEAKQDSDAYAVHPIVHRWCLTTVDVAQQQELARLAIILIGCGVPGGSSKRYWSAQLRLLPHANWCIENSMARLIESDGGMVMAAFYNLGILYSDQGKMAQAEAMYRRALHGTEGRHEPDSQMTLHIVNNLGTLHQRQGRLAEADAMFQRALAGYEKQCGAHDLSTLDLCHNLGTFYQLQGRFSEAEAMYQRALLGKEKVLEPEAVSILGTISNLGGLYLEYGKLAEAEGMLQRALLGDETASGNDLRLMTFSKLGTVYRAQGRMAEAEAMFQQVLERYEKEQRPDHFRINTFNDLGKLYHDQGRVPEAEATFQWALQAAEKVLGPDNLSTLNTVENLGTLYLDQGKPAEAEAAFFRALTGFEKALGPTHVSTLNSVSNLGCVYSEQGRKVEADVMLQRALEGLEKTVGEDDLRIVYSVHTLGMLYQVQGKLAEAETMFQRELAGREKIHGPCHVSTLATVHNLGSLYGDQEKMVEAEAMYRRALEGSEKVLGPLHPLTLGVVANLGRLYRKKNDHDESLSYFMRAHEGHAAAKGSEAPETINAQAEVDEARRLADEARCCRST